MNIETYNKANDILNKIGYLKAHKEKVEDCISRQYAIVIESEYFRSGISLDEELLNVSSIIKTYLLNIDSKIAILEKELEAL